jgi:outer membrane lipoprotein-sorting protein
MRWLSLMVVSLFAATAAAQENDAEKLFRAMEKKIRAAKSFQMEFEGTVDFGMDKGSIKGKLYFAEKNKFRLEGTMEHDGKKEASLMVADGKSIVNRSSDAAPGQTRTLEENDQDKWRGYIARSGVVASVLLMAERGPGDAEKGPFDLDKAMGVKDFKLGAKEKVGGREVQVVEYTAQVDKEVKAKVSVWIDTRTNLPLKRVLEAGLEGGKEMARFVETYSNFSVDGRISEKLFEIPK